MDRTYLRKVNQAAHLYRQFRCNYITEESLGDQLAWIVEEVQDMASIEGAHMAHDRDAAIACINGMAA